MTAKKNTPKPTIDTQTDVRVEPVVITEFDALTPGLYSAERYPVTKDGFFIPIRIAGNGLWQEVDLDNGAIAYDIGNPRGYFDEAGPFTRIGD